MKYCEKCGRFVEDNAGNLCEKCLMKSKFSNIEKTIYLLSNVLLIIGIIVSIIMLFSIVIVETVFSTKFSLMGLAITISTLFSSILFWALLRLAVEVSVNIREILKKQ